MRINHGKTGTGTVLPWDCEIDFECLKTGQMYKIGFGDSRQKLTTISELCACPSITPWNNTSFVFHPGWPVGTNSFAFCGSTFGNYLLHSRPNTSRKPEWTKIYVELAHKFSDKLEVAHLAGRILPRQIHASQIASKLPLQDVFREMILRTSELE